jgi:polysaccharide export outer membrane protein
LNTIEEIKKIRKKLMVENGYDVRHPRIVGLDADIASAVSQLRNRLQVIVDTARLNADVAAKAADRYKTSYDELNRTPQSAAGTPVRNAELSKAYVVQSDGSILLPYVGSVRAAGVTRAALQTAIRAGLAARGMKVTRVLASIEGGGSLAVFVVGEVKKPGLVIWRSGMTVADAISLAGGRTQPLAAGGIMMAGPDGIGNDTLLNALVVAPAYIAVAKVDDPRSEPASARGSAPVPPPPSTIVPPATAARQVPGYVIGPNDVLRVTVYSSGISQADFAQSNYIVQPDGTVALPLLKPLKLTGLSVRSANALIKQALIDARQFSDCIADITVVQYRSSKVTVQGAVRAQGSIQMTADRMNVADALNQAGGLQPSAGNRIRVKRAGGRTSAEGVTVENGWEIYSRDDLNTGKLADIRLFDGDRVDVPVAPQYYVEGFVAYPGEMRWEDGLTLERALIKAGGVTNGGSDDHVEVRRMDPSTKTSHLVPLDKDKANTLILAGDVIIVKKR